MLTHCYLCWVPHLKKRKILRQKYRLKEEPCNDCLVTAFCSAFAVCQEARELKARGMFLTNLDIISLFEILAGPQSGRNIMPIRNQPQVAYRK